MGLRKWKSRTVGRVGKLEELESWKSWKVGGVGKLESGRVEVESRK